VTAEMSWARYSDPADIFAIEITLGRYPLTWDIKDRS
jgi:hypothetical protein